MHTYGVCIGMLVCTLLVYVYVTHRSASFSQKWNKLRWCSKTPSCFQFFQGLDSDLGHRGSRQTPAGGYMCTHVAHIPPAKSACTEGTEAFLVCLH